MTREAAGDGRVDRGFALDALDARNREPATGRREVPRRRFVGLASVSIALGLAGCLGRDPVRGTTTHALAPTTVTTTGGEGIEILVARMVIRDDADGPRVYYRLRNGGDADATTTIRTVLRVEDGGTYESTAYADVSAGDEVFVEYRVVTWAELGDGDAEDVRRRNADFETYVDGQHRPAV